MSLHISDEVEDALHRGNGVVAIESTIIAHGLPWPQNLEVADELERAVRDQGAVPATIAVLDGSIHVGLSIPQREQIAARDDVVKASIRDLPLVVANRMNAATTVASTAHIARLAGIPVFATGGIGGVHRGAAETFDESADLYALATIPIIVVCAGVKSILDVGATLERLESYSVPVLVFGADVFPGFYLSDSGHPAPLRVDTQQEVVAVARAQARLGLPQATLVAQPVPAHEQMDPVLHDRILEEALAAAGAAGVAGKAMTPFLLERFHGASDGASVAVNRRLAVRNAELAARIATSM